MNSAHLTTICLVLLILALFSFQAGRISEMAPEPRCAGWFIALTLGLIIGLSAGVIIGIADMIVKLWN